MAVLWRCPKCGREFRNKNQWHSCVSYSAEDHFSDKSPMIREMFDRILSHLRKIGPIRVDAVKTSINLAGRSHFAGITPQKSSMNVGFMYDKELDDPRIVKTIKLSDTSFAYRVKLKGPEDIDGRLLGWLEYSYKLKSGKAADGK